jgi:outer membrane protein OmpA-like peptidoglycan-associated protein
MRQISLLIATALAAASCGSTAQSSVTGDSVPPILEASVAAPTDGDSGAGREVTFPERWLTAEEVPFAAREDEPESTDLPSEDFDLDEPIELSDTVLFTRGTAIISAAADATLASLAAQAARQLGPSQGLRIDGHVDEVGSAEFNDELAQDRADAVLLRLVRHEPALEGRLAAVGHGETELLHPECRGDCPINRAVVITRTD